ncbi:MAG: hypothetical protein K2I72_00850 [Bacilli bacterium]|nr:hypothetical protein [Bacilli bacterium]
MVKQEAFLEAISETLKSHPLSLKDLKRWFYGSIMDGVNLQSFTRENDARNKVEGITSDNFLALTLESVINYYYLAVKEKSQDSLAEECSDLIQIMKVPEINAALYFKTRNEKLLQAIDIAVKYLYQSDFIADNLTQNHSDLLEKIFSDIKEASDIDKIQINHKAINSCVMDILDGTQLKNQRTSYLVDGNLYATQDIGKVRGNQEDSVLIMSHPEIPEFKFLAVSDGMGGVEYGEEASNYTVKQLSEWFPSLPKDLYHDVNLIVQKLNNKIQEISQEITIHITKKVSVVALP